MKTLPWTKENLPEISRTLGISMHAAEEVLLESERLSFPVYAVIGFIAFGNGKLNTRAHFIGVSLFERHYEHIEHVPDNQWRMARVKK